MHVPDDVKAWIRAAFESVNQRVSEKISRIPTSQEASLDMTFIEEVTQCGAPTILPSLWGVEIQTHFLGGMRHWRRFEVADIGVIVMFRRAGTILRTKVVLLQSKRLYANELAEPDEETREDYGFGFVRLWAQTNAPNLGSRNFTFTEASKYIAMGVRDEQHGIMQEYEEQVGIPVYYLFYNPCVLPWARSLPARGEYASPPSNNVGCRVVPRAKFTAATAVLPQGSSPSYLQIAAGLPAPFTDAGHRGGWRLEHFVADEVVTCREGRIHDGAGLDDALNSLFYRRSGPIAAALAVTIDLAPDADIQGTA